MRALGASLAREWQPGDIVFLEGPLGAGKTTLARGVLESLGVAEPVRSPTYNLIQVFETDPPIVHADLYRVASHVGLGLEDYVETHVCLIEWPDRATGLVPEPQVWKVAIAFADSGRLVTVTSPKGRTQ